MSNDDEAVEISPIVIVRETEKAFAVEFTEDDEDDGTYWIPKSQILDSNINAEGESGWMEIPKWLATEKGLV